MKRYKNFVMLEQMKECIRTGQQDDAIEIAESLDIKSIKNNSDINLMADLYIENGMIEKGYECLREIYGRKKTRGLMFQLLNVSLEMKNVNAAEKYFADYTELSGNDFYNYIFRYKIDKLKGKPINELIAILEKLKSVEYIEAWAYELAKLYHKSGMEEKCVKECNDIEIWFGDGPYVERAKMLKAYHMGELDMDSLAAEKEHHGIKARHLEKEQYSKKTQHVDKAQRSEKKVTSREEKEIYDTAYFDRETSVENSKVPVWREEAHQAEGQETTDQYGGDTTVESDHPAKGPGYEQYIPDQGEETGSGYNGETAGQGVESEDAGTGYNEELVGQDEDGEEVGTGYKEELAGQGENVGTGYDGKTAGQGVEGEEVGTGYNEELVGQDEDGEKVGTGYKEELAGLGEDVRTGYKEEFAGQGKETGNGYDSETAGQEEEPEDSYETVHTDKRGYDPAGSYENKYTAGKENLTGSETGSCETGEGTGTATKGTAIEETATEETATKGTAIEEAATEGTANKETETKETETKETRTKGIQAEETQTRRTQNLELKTEEAHLNADIQADTGTEGEPSDVSGTVSETSSEPDITIEDKVDAVSVTGTDTELSENESYETKEAVTEHPEREEDTEPVPGAELSGGDKKTETKTDISKEDDFAEELKEYEEEAVAETAEINISTGIPEGDDAWIYSYLEEGEKELGKQIQMEFEKDREYQKNWNNEERKWREARQADSKSSKKQDTNDSNDEETVEESIAAALEGQTNEILHTAGDDVASDKESDDTADIESILNDVKPIDPKSLLGSLLDKRNEKMEDYFGFYAYQTDVRQQLTKNLEIMLNPQFKNICMVITGTRESEKNIIIKGIKDILFRGGILSHDQVYKVEAERLNASVLNAKSSKLLGTCFVIRYAEKMNKESAEALLALNGQFAGKTAIVLTDSRSGINSLFKDNRGLNSMFPQRVHIPVFNEKDLEKLVYYRLVNADMKISNKARTELQKKIKDLLHEEDDPMKKLDKIISTAIDSVSTRNARNFLRQPRLGNSKFRDNNVITLNDLK